MGGLMIRAVKISVSLALSLVGNPALGADIYVGVTSEDTVGQTLVYEIREKISKSQRHNLVSSPKDAAFKLSVVTLRGDGQTVYSISLLMRNFQTEGFFDFFVTSWVGYCGSRAIESCAANIVAGVDTEIEPIVRAVSESLTNK